MNSAAMALLYSVILTKGIETVRSKLLHDNLSKQQCNCKLFSTNIGLKYLWHSIISDEMDGENVPLIGAHGYCSQEMVNLLLTGRAVSNTFDGHITISESGISRASDENDTIGLFYIVRESCVPMHNILYYKDKAS